MKKTQPLQLETENGYYKNYTQIDEIKHKKLTVKMTVNQWHTLQQILAWELVRSMIELEEKKDSINPQYPNMIRRIGAQIEKQTGLINESEREYEGFK